jgi:hypothetical protein|tara:strand:- start:236 stop:985 length:750 start_codon:yes stop_codon:yes gene_type:complete
VTIFNKFKSNIHSQSGEDGVIIEIIKRIKIKNKRKMWCCEFGAWDGIHGSNTFNLVKNFDYNAVYIEGNKSRFKDLLKTKNKFPKIKAYNIHISHKKKSPNLLDRVLKKTKIPKDFEILSIDIDSHDLAVWKSLKKYQPKIIIIEINSGIVPGILQTHSKRKEGNSFSSTVNYAKKIGYELVCHTGNCIFIKKKYLKNIKINKRYISKPELLFDYTWLNKKENILKKIIKIILPNKILDILRKFKRRLI